MPDLEDELDSAFFQVPFPECYFDFGRSVSSGNCRVAGVYLSAANAPLEDGLRRIEVAVVLNRSGKADYREVVEVCVEVENSGAIDFGSLLDAKERQGRLAAADRQMVERVLLLGQKILLYAGLRSARKVARHGLVEVETAQPTRDDSETQSSRVIERFEFVEIGPERLAREKAEEGTTRSTGMHWRRGHFRMQRYGQGLELCRRIWIMPVLVLPGAEEGLIQQDIRTYRVS
jgi:hypothetical protein